MITNGEIIMITYFALTSCFFGMFAYFGVYDLIEAVRNDTQLELPLTLFIVSLCGMFTWSVGMLAWQFL